MPSHSRALILASAVGILGLSGCGEPATADDPVAENVQQESGRDLFAEAGSSGPMWLTYGGSYDEQRYSQLEGIAPANVSRLGIAWTYDLRSDRGVEATPIVHDGVMYVTASWSVLHAVDAATGAPLWVYDPKVERSVGANACCDAVSRGVAWKDGVLFLAVLDGRLEAIDAGTGARLWSVQTTDKAKPYTITGAPRVVKNMVLIGNSGDAFGVRGYVSAYDIDTGKLVWRFYTVPNPNKRLDGAASDDVLTGTANPTWGNSGAWKTDGGGGTVADSIVYDVRNDQLLFGVGSGSPWNAALRDPNGEGDNLFLSSIVAVDADTGRYRWHYQETPRDSWGYGATQSIVLADLPLGEEGASRHVVLHAPKNGFFYVLDAQTGEYISGKGFMPQTWTTGLDPDGRPMETPEARPPAGAAGTLLPGAFGAHDWKPMAFNPKLGLTYVPAQELPRIQAPLEAADPAIRGNRGYALEAGVPGDPPDAETLKELRATARNSLLAWDPVKQEARWSVDLPANGGGVLATASGLVFQGTADGMFAAYNAQTGRRLWRTDVRNGVEAPPVSYELDGQQYVAVATGLGGAQALGAGYLLEKPVTANRGLLVAFQLGGKEALPAAEAPPAIERTPAAAFGDNPLREAGRLLYSRNCADCHGVMAISSGVLPDLRWSAVSGDATRWRSLVLDGLAADAGMPGFSRQLDAASAEAIRAYVLQQAHGPGAAAKTRKPSANAKAPAKGKGR